MLRWAFAQPPSGGCVLKHGKFWKVLPLNFPAAFGRLCVETEYLRSGNLPKIPAAFGRLCVETIELTVRKTIIAPAAFGRLCVETALPENASPKVTTSRLRAAVC